MTDNHTGHSAEVKMQVVRDGAKLQVSQLGPDFLLLDEADDFEGPAQVVLSVDGVTHSCSPNAVWINEHRKDNLVPVDESHRSLEFLRASTARLKPLN